ncbi:hypothetical protein GCM10028807_51970 [Spirosoma daeguense]
MVIDIDSPKLAARLVKSSFSVWFRLRPAEPGKVHRNPCPLQIRITVDGDEDSGFSARLKVDPLLWDQMSQTTKGKTQVARETAAELNKIKLALHQIEQRQRSSYLAGDGLIPTRQSIKAEYICRYVNNQPYVAQTLHMSLQDAVRKYVAYLRGIQSTGEGKADKTIDAYERNLRFMVDYLSETGLPEPNVKNVTPFWVKQYWHYLLKRKGLRRKDKTLGAGQCTLICRQLVHALDHLFDAGVIDRNPLDSLKLKYVTTKPVYFLEPVHVLRLWQLRVADLEEASLWWTKLLCLTGLDYPDAQRYVFNRRVYEQTGPGGKKIVINRSKPPYRECNIPYLDELAQLFEQSIPKAPRIGKLCYDMEKFREYIGFTLPLTPKICRKTAGTIFIINGHSIKGTSNILGHATTATTERHYVKVTGVTVDLEMPYSSRSILSTISLLSR